MQFMAYDQATMNEESAVAIEANHASEAVINFSRNLDLDARSISELRRVVVWKVPEEGEEKLLMLYEVNGSLIYNATRA